MINTLRTMISKWVMEDKLDDQQIGRNIRKHYWKEIHSYEHWIWQDDEAEMSGYGYDDARIWTSAHVGYYNGTPYARRHTVGAHRVR